MFVQGRVGFYSHGSGERFALSGPCTAKNHWTAPLVRFYAEDIVGQFLVKLKPSAAVSGFELALDSDGQVIQSAMVQGFVSCNNEIVTYGPLRTHRDADGLVAVTFGKRRLREASEDVPCCSLSDISTPRSIMSNGQS